MVDSDKKKSSSSSSSSIGSNDNKNEGITQMIEKIAKPLGAFLTAAIPIVITYGNKAFEIYGKLPQNFVRFTFLFWNLGVFLSCLVF